MDRLAAPSPFTSEGSLSEKWKTWKSGFDFYMCATESDQKSDKIKPSILLTCIGERGREIYETFDFANAADKLKLDPILQKFESYCNPRSNTTIMRHKFFTYRQSEGQTFNDFVTELKKLSADCAFDTLKDSLIKDMIICGVSGHGLRERMLREPDINLKKAVELGQAAEETKLHAKQLAEDMSRSVHKIRKHKHGIPKDKEEKRSKSHAKTAVKMINNCKFCAGSHPRRKCPAYGQKCNSCHKKNHFARCCNREVHQVSNQVQESNTSSDSDTDFVIDSIVITDRDPNLINDFDQSIKIDAIEDDERHIGQYVWRQIMKV